MKHAAVHRSLVLVLAVWCICMPGHALDLTHDPFKRPDLLVKPPATNALPSADRNAAEVSVAPLEGDLRATIQAGSYSMVNVGGEILMLGDTLEGYRLVQVGEIEAIFEKNGIKRTLSLIDRESQQR